MARTPMNGRNGTQGCFRLNRTVWSSTTTASLIELMKLRLRDLFFGSRIRL